MKNSSDVSISELTLPKGGGALTGMNESLGQAGPSGMASLTVPLPVSAGRGNPPSLSLNYNSGGGNGPFGTGWQLDILSIRRRTSKGVPRYMGGDEFIGPDNEVLYMALNDEGLPDIRRSRVLQGIELDEDYQVTRYCPRIENTFSKTELWQPAEKTKAPFWLISTPDGQVHILGKTAQSRIESADTPSQIAVWLLEESLTPTGESVYYQYRAEDDAGCHDSEKNAHPQAHSQRYIDSIYYGNIHPANSFFCLSTEPYKLPWLFILRFDYGERSDALSDVPTFTASSTWLCRQDSFSRYDYGFEIRTRRLCRQVLMYHRLQSLSGKGNGYETPFLVQRFILRYEERGHLALLLSCQRLGHEDDGAPVALPPLEFNYSRFTLPSKANWETLPELDGLPEDGRYQLVDLNGEGIPGLLCQEQGQWSYRSPCRTAGVNTDRVHFGEKEVLTNLPLLQENARLFDINGDGRLDWVVTSPGLQGYYRRQPDNTWAEFTPLSALPSEYFHPHAQLADITGAGLSDLVMIGPKSVRFYASNRDGWQSAETVSMAHDTSLSVPATDKRKLVVFTDLLGSGQQHLAEISAAGVTCWPNLGHGRFGPALSIRGFTPEATTFDPERVYMADIDGSGTTDIIYVQKNSIQIYFNKSGNYFSAPQELALPEGVYFDNTCQLNIADIHGLGVATLVLYIPHLSSRHWYCVLGHEKSTLLTSINNNRGLSYTLYYRNSAQFWLDDKAALSSVEACYLPFPIHLLARTIATDEISGNQLISEMTYHHGAWDGQEREFRGFGCVEQRDAEYIPADESGVRTPPKLTRSWFSTGIRAVDSLFVSAYWKGDTLAWPNYSPRYTLWDNVTQQDSVLTPPPEQHYWFERATKGQLLREEVYGLDGSSRESVPFQVTESRYQIRCLNDAQKQAPLLWVSQIEQRQYHYERITSDPRCTQTVQLRSDRYGLPTESVTVHYPRRATLTDSEYPDSLPGTLLNSSQDGQQQMLRLMRQRNSWFHITQGENWVLGLPDAERRDVYNYSNYNVSTGLLLESLLASDSLVGTLYTPVFMGQQRTVYCAGEWSTTLAEPSRQALVAYTEVAVFDDNAMTAFSPAIEVVNIPQALNSAGYSLAQRVFDSLSDQSIWVTRKNYTRYHNADKFYRPLQTRTSELTGTTSLVWDKQMCRIIQSSDPEHNVVSAEYDYRHLLPVLLTDANMNRHAVTLDALGRVTTKRFWKGIDRTDNNIWTDGYTPSSTKPFVVPGTVEQAMALSGGIPVSQAFIYFDSSWVRDVPSLSWSYNNSQFESANGVVLATVTSRLPPHILMLATDRYDNDPEQQIRMQVTFCDGFGRILQQSTRHTPGQAWQRTEEGGLRTTSEGKLTEVYSTLRWSVTGKMEYNNKGLETGRYPPYFLNDWRYVNDDSARKDIWSDRYYYDPLGRMISVKTAKSYWIYKTFYPWFVINEDENDTSA
ncbi:virulence protein [Enterobacter asburiae]|uniref:SpvB/TcaC N-terminal domain-containing protein n=1 Tax=Enterobacter asburiae TaxID=61645 RepID=UPI00192BD502|nr:SpvB/TcaC N-terminal domain-containing protein [Enterobacter asburiae]MBL5950222.1 virulence protein [Enterobacter asburiae]